MDVDGVLNCMSTKERYNGFIGVDDALLRNFAEFIRTSNEEEETQIVLSSSWRIGQDRSGAEIPDGYEYIQTKLAEHGLSIYDDTPRLKCGDDGYRKRGREIAAWLYLNRDKEISGYVVLDDVFFDDFKKYKISAHLVRTSPAYNGGFHKDNGKQALRILRLPVTIDADVDPADEATEEVMIKKMDTNKRIGKYVSMLLRHHPEEAGVVLDEHGWTDVEDLIEKVQPRYPLTVELLQELAYGKDKQRYEFSDDGKKVRAVHGHSVDVDLGYEEKQPPSVLYHGSATKFSDSIGEKGLLKQNRQFVHLSENVEQAKSVGRRHGKLILYGVKAEEMYRDGHKFYRSTSGVWLTDHVPVQYLKIIPEGETS